MHFDDRLDTVLKQPMRGQAIARIQYVQLLDLLGKSAPGGESARFDPAYERLLALANKLPGRTRAGLLRGSGLTLRNPALVAFLAEDEPDVAGAAIAAAELDEPQWLDLIPALSIGARGILRHRRDLGPVVEARLDRLGVADRGLPPAPQTGAAANAPDATPAPAAAAPPSGNVVPIPAPAKETPKESEIGALVRRIEAWRKAHPAPIGTAAPESPRLPLGDPDHIPHGPVARFDFVTDASGRITRADAIAAPMLIGLSLGRLPCRRIASPASQPAEALRLRHPIEGQVVAIGGAPSISGDWRIDAAPLFDAATGRYLGHAGRARRLSADHMATARNDTMADRMRQVLHELRNPAGAIQMASEFIQQQVGGPISHEYRAIAASIASDTATVLAGLDELDRLVKFDAGVAALEPGETDIRVGIQATAALLNQHMAQRESALVPDLPDAPLPVAIASADLDRLTWRLLAAIAGAAGPMEQLALKGEADAQTARLAIALPAALRDLTDDELFAAQTRQRGPALSAGVFGLGFTLRLAAAEARSAGGSLRREGAELVLSLPIEEQASAKIRGG
jgi:two-component system, OmpR family, sensor kinase